MEEIRSPKGKTISQGATQTILCLRCPDWAKEPATMWVKGPTDWPEPICLDCCRADDVQD